MRQRVLLVSCEHGVNHVPPAYQRYFAPYHALLTTHRAIDFGALALANYFHAHFHCDFMQAQATRLLIDCNRSLKHPRCFSEVTKALPFAEKQQIIQHYYIPFRDQVENKIKQQLAAGKQVLHLSIHSFTPVFNMIVRHADIGLLYDPKRQSEKTIAKCWQQQLQQAAQDLRVRMNYPYRGISDGFTSALRQQFNDKEYAGLEVEINQNLVKEDKQVASLAATLAITLQPFL